MTPRMFEQITRAIERQLEPGEGYHLNLRMKSGAQWRDYAWRTTSISENVIELSRTDHPPVWVDLGEVESVELAA